MDRGQLGKLGEDIACQFLVAMGFTILERNFRRPWGEIDVIALKANTVRFVEVKAVTRESSSTAVGRYTLEEQAHFSKLQKVARTAELYMASKRDRREFQLDVLAVRLDLSSRRAQCRLYEQAL